MKVKHNKPAGIFKDQTVIGQVYKIADSDRKCPYFRIAIGFVNLEDGYVTQMPNARNDAVWVHQPDATIHL